VRATLDALDSARKKLEETGNFYQQGKFRGRDVITHLHLVDYADIPLASELGIIGSFQPFWHFKEPEWYEKIDLAFLGEERAVNAYPVASFIKAGITVTFSGDYPASPINNAFWAIEAAVTRNLPNEAHYNVEPISSVDDPAWLRCPSERISLKEAIEAYTINGAKQLFREEEIGSLAAGKLADFVVLSEDIFSIPTLDIDKITIEATFISGERVCKRA
jgi:predicted amidohydrolase YtcJ